MRFFFLKALFSCLVTSTFFLTGCNSTDSIHSIQEPEVLLDRGPEGDCSGEVPFTPNFSVVSADDYPGFDLALQVSGNSPALPPGCTCGTTTYTFDLDMNYIFVQEVGIASSGDNQMNVDLIYEDQDGFALEFRAPDGYNTNPEPIGNQEDNLFTVCFEATDGDIILFDFYGGTPGGPESTSVIDNVGGICIVDNIGKSENP